MQVGTNRLESFSDAVIAVAITLLVLGITVPAPGSGESLGHALLSKWPEYAAYVTSFVTIGIIWINHHVMINRLACADHAILILKPAAADEHRRAALCHRAHGHLSA
jgi:uncharacterized membrane protein